MNKIPQTVRIIHTKDYNVDVLYIKEFLRTIGCLTCNYIKRDNLQLTSEEKKQQYDVNIFYGLNEDISQSNMRNEIYIKESFIKSAGSRDNILTAIIDGIWPQGQYRLIRSEIKKILEFYGPIATCLYNNVNIGFISEYCPVNNDGAEVIELKKRICGLTYDAFLKCYNELYNYKKNNTKQKLSVYYEYTMLNLKHRINEIKKLDHQEAIFDVTKMINDARKILEKKEDFIIVYYRLATICKFDSMYEWNAEEYYWEVIERLDGLHEVPKMLKSIFYYNLGRYYEKNMGNKELAYKCYLQSNENNPHAYRTLFKLAKIEEEKQNYKEVIHILNKIIENLIDDYKDKYDYGQLMPREQIYVFKVYRLMGDTFYQMGELQYAEKAYLKAIEISRVKSRYFIEMQTGIDKEFEKLLKISMSSDAIYRKLINCVSRDGDEEKYREYLSLC